MIVIRSAEPKDLAALQKLAHHLSSYNFPSDAAGLRRLIRVSVDSFSGKMRDRSSRIYLFVAQDIRSGHVIGSSMIIARHGTPRMPHLSFRVGHGQLKLSVNHLGFTEVGGLVVLPKYRHSDDHVGRQLSLVRFAYMAGRESAFRPRILVEYLPKLDREGNAFWRALGKRLTGLTYAEADRLSASTKDFILKTFPKTPIDISLLPKDAQRGIGVPGPGAEASIHMLQKLGFRFLNQVDPFDGGPYYGAVLKKIKLVHRTARVRIEPCDTLKDTSPERIVLRAARGRVRACVARVELSGRSRVRLTRKIAQLLNLKSGDEASITGLCPKGIR